MLTYPKIETSRLEQEPQTVKNRFGLLDMGKRIFDILLASVVTITVLTWLIPAVGLFIKLSSPGPVLFVQIRTGRNNRPFRCLKFRTMLYDTNPAFRQALRNDPRVTSVGRWLRRTNLDEMPQFLNVLIGDMSIVGPRPHAIQHDTEYWNILPDYSRRYSVRPGITGLAQVRGARGLTDDILKMKHRLRYDLYYIRKRSLLRDVLICWWTIKSMFSGNTNAW